MRIAFVSAHVGAHTRALAETLAEDHNVTIYTRRENSRHATRESISGGLEIVRLAIGPAGRLPESEQLGLVQAFGLALAEAWATNPPDVVHSQSWLSGLAALVGRENRSIPIAHTCHGLISAWLRHGKLTGFRSNGDNSARQNAGVAERVRLERAIAHDVDHLIATSHAEINELRAMGVRTSKASVVPSGVDLERFRLAPADIESDAAGLADNRPWRPRLLVLDGIAPHQGADAAVAALQGVPGAELVIAGGPPAASLKRDAAALRLRALAEHCGVAERVKLVGAVPDEELPQLLASADAVLSVPSYEPIGTAALEAMASSRTVIATSVGALTDVVIPGTTGVFVPHGDPRRLAAATRGLLSDPLRLEGYGLAGRERAEFRHNWSRIAAETAQVYEKLTAGSLMNLV